ncbi:MAG: adaptor protein MecA [Clostridia bacterium]
MKVEKLSNDKIRITLSFEELDEREISLTDLVKDSSKAQQIFFKIFEETELEEEFLLEDSQLLVEASTSSDDCFILTITRVFEDVVPAISKYNSKNYEPFKYKIKYSVSSNIFRFNSLDDILDFSKKALNENLYLGFNSLYKYKNSYYILFKETTVKNKRFLKTFIIASEYCEEYFCGNTNQSVILEKAKLIIKNKALQKLCKV